MSWGAALTIHDDTVVLEVLCLEREFVAVIEDRLKGHGLSFLFQRDMSLLQI